MPQSQNQQMEQDEQDELLRRRLEERARQETEPEESGKALLKRPQVRAYVNKGQRYEDMHSSASAFFFICGVLAAIVLLNLTGILRLPLIAPMDLIFPLLAALLAAGCFLVAFSSRKRAFVLKQEAAEEEQQTEDILSWFLKTYTAKELDEQLLMEEPELSGEELVLKRYELIQDFLITGRDIPDQAYADSLCDLLYARLYEQEESA